MKNAEKLSITLPAEIVRIIREKVESGVYSSNSEVIREAMRGWIDKEEHLRHLDNALTRGLNDIREGRIEDLETVRSDLKKRFSI